jgi:hypothetical protein
MLEEEKFKDAEILYRETLEPQILSKNQSIASLPLVPFNKKVGVTSVIERSQGENLANPPKKKVKINTLAR